MAHLKLPCHACTTGITRVVQGNSIWWSHDDGQATRLTAALNFIHRGRGFPFVSAKQQAKCGIFWTDPPCRHWLLLLFPQRRKPGLRNDTKSPQLATLGFCLLLCTTDFILTPGHWPYPELITSSFITSMDSLVSKAAANTTSFEFVLCSTKTTLPA